MENRLPNSIARISYAQNQEDILLDRLFQNVRGTFVDVGAHHPVFDSNTYFFYERGWRGVNLEPLPGFHQLLCDCRPEDTNLRIAVSDKEGERPFYEVQDCQGYSTLSAEVAAEHHRHGAKVVEHRVPVRTLSSLIAEYRIEPPDLLCIDVEGHEAAVVRGMPLAAWRPRVVVVEATLPGSPVLSHQTWEPLLLAHGYLLALFNGLNRFYLRDDLGDQLPVLQVPVNVFDSYRTVETVLLENRVRELEAQLRQLRP